MTFVLQHHPQNLSKSWCQLVTKDNSLAMMGSVSPLMRDVTRYQIAGRKQLCSTYIIHTCSFYRDESDEDDCQMLVMKTNYNSKISPFTFDYVNSKVVPVNVNISMAVIDVLSILEKDLLYVLKFRFYMSWYDYRLKYHNIKRSKMLNSLSSNEVNKLWIPFVVFSNTENSEFTEGNKETEVTISREGDFTESSLDIVEEINIFEGSQNRITFQQIYSKTFRCLYELQLYPFDSQVVFKIS